MSPTSEEYGWIMETNNSAIEYSEKSTLQLVAVKSGKYLVGSGLGRVLDCWIEPTAEI